MKRRNNSFNNEQFSTESLERSDKKEEKYFKLKAFAVILWHFAYHGPTYYAVISNMIEMNTERQ